MKGKDKISSMGVFSKHTFINLYFALTKEFLTMNNKCNAINSVSNLFLLNSLTLY